eukprot:TRINITY_DN2975_c0_g1_i2.p1 TRINITY_DN2975_c0_g1~~TRINITY_DN2975_c0_g1_i2.p1  ORF type:complete len:147 (+),score=25.27 TRINITY_DN2975_c0_g1_i2:449-889(+)
MANRATLTSAHINMRKHPSSFKVLGPILEKLNQVMEEEGPQVLYEGPVRDLCQYAPSNVNTMACLSLAGIGFDETTCQLISDKSLEAHVIEVTIEGPEKPGLGTFSVSSTRYNPAAVGAVTGSATYASFLSSLLKSSGRGDGFHFC